MLGIYNLTRGVTLVLEGQVALSFWERARGLLGTRRLPESEALIISPCRGIHTVGLRFPILAVYLDRDSRVLTSVVLRPWRIGPFLRRARTVIEMPAYMVDQVIPGDRLMVVVGGRPTQKAGRTENPSAGERGAGP